MKVELESLQSPDSWRPSFNGNRISPKDYLARLSSRLLYSLILGEVTHLDILRAGGSNGGNKMGYIRLPTPLVDHIKALDIDLSVFLRAVIASANSPRNLERLKLESEWLEVYKEDPSDYPTAFLLLHLRAHPDPDPEMVWVKQTLTSQVRLTANLERRVLQMQGLVEAYVPLGIKASNVPPRKAVLQAMNREQLLAVALRWGVMVDSRHHTNYLRQKIGANFGYSFIGQQGI